MFSLAFDETIIDLNKSAKSSPNHHSPTIDKLYLFFKKFIDFSVKRCVWVPLRCLGNIFSKACSIKIVKLAKGTEIKRYSALDFLKALKTLCGSVRCSSTPIKLTHDFFIFN